MAAETVAVGDLADRIGEAVRADLVGNNVLGQLLVEQASRRVEEGGDSEHRYPDLWDNPWSYRAGGQPLTDTGLSVQALHGDTADEQGRITARLFVDGPHFYMVYHQHGFTTKGPNYIPLTRRGRLHRTGVDPKTEGFVELMPDGGRRKLEDGRVVETDDPPDYLMVWRGVTVPQRKLFNLPPEDVAEIRDAVHTAIMRVR